MTTIDTSELIAFAASLNAGAGRLGARTAAVFRKGAFDMEATMKGLAAVDTGAMRGSISTDIIGDGRSGTMAAEIGPTVDYAVYVDGGTSTQPPQPFVGPAFDRHIGPLSAALAALGDELLG